MEEGQARGKGGGGGWGRGRGRGGKPKGSSQRAVPPSKQLRAIERLLRKADLPADVRATKEKEKAALQASVQKQARVSREKHFSKKYHGIKFFERRKVERRISQLERAISAGEALETNKAALLEAQHDLLYIKHFPSSKKYLALFPSKDADNGYVAKRRRRMRALIVRRVEAGLPVGRVDSRAELDEDYDDAPADHGDVVEEDDFFAHAEDDDDADATPAVAAGSSSARDDAVAADRDARTKKKRRRSADDDKHDETAFGIAAVPVAGDDDGANPRKKKKKKRADEE